MSRFRVPVLLPLLVTAAAFFAAAGTGWAQQVGQPSPTFAELLARFSSASADFCGDGGADWEDSSDSEFRLFQRAGEELAQALNVPPAPGSTNREPRAVAAAALEDLERRSAAINSAWDEDSRFHFEVLDLPPALVVKLTFRNRATFAFFANFQGPDDPKRTTRWHAVGALDDHMTERNGPPYESLELYPLAKGPSKEPRFLAEFGASGCDVSAGVGYYAYEWDSDFGQLVEIIKVEGDGSVWDDSVASPDPQQDPQEDAFPPIGKLETEGPAISLPYCWHSAVDTWINPNLCAVNHYDISGDSVKFTGSEVNRPDLLPIAKAVEYAEARDYPAVLAYCGSPDVAQRIIRDIPLYVEAVTDLQITRIDPTHKRVVMGDDQVTFEVEQRGDRWVVTGFHVD